MSSFSVLRFIQFFFIFDKQFDVVRVHKVVDFFSCDLWSLYPLVHFPKFVIELSLSYIVMVIVYLTERFLTGISPQLIFFLLLSVPFHSFSQFSRWTSWLRWISCTFCDGLSSNFAGPYRMSFCCQSTPWLDFPSLVLLVPVFFHIISQHVMGL